MKKRLLFQLVLLITSFSCFSQPYSGTSFVDPDIIISSDSSAFVNVTYIGREIKTIYDRRVNDWISVNAFLFEVVWNDGLESEAVINPEFGTKGLAEFEAKKYGRSIGQLPHCLRIDVNEIWINKGVQHFAGGYKAILIHTGQSVLYEDEGVLEEILGHEACHTSLDRKHSASTGWLDAQELDGGFISDYAEEFPEREDLAESFSLWLAVRHRDGRISPQDFNLITDAIPNRLNYIDGIGCNLFPFEIENTTSQNEIDYEESKVVVYPNPAIDYVQLKLNNKDIYRAIIYNSLGDVVLSSYLENSQQIDISEFTNGVYFLVLQKDGEQTWKKIIKN